MRKLLIITINAIMRLRITSVRGVIHLGALQAHGEAATRARVSC
jgi:hypothetical protein